MNKKKETPVPEGEEKITVNPRFFEAVPPNAVVGIKIVNVSKVRNAKYFFSKKRKTQHE